MDLSILWGCSVGFAFSFGWDEERNPIFLCRLPTFLYRAERLPHEAHFPACNKQIVPARFPRPIECVLVLT